MCYTVIWLDSATNEPFFSQEIANPDRTMAWEQISQRSKTYRVLALIPGHHGVIFNKDESLTSEFSCVKLSGK
jgi:hypothetical protein